MANPLAVVPGSRRPIRIDSTGVVVNIAIQRSDLSSVSSKLGSNSSASRRKPQTTYRSPSVQFPNDLRIERPGHCIRRSPSGHGPFPPPTRSSHASPTHGGAAGASVPAPVKPKYPMKPPLPIYHPLGRLALSLPQLDFSLHPPGSLSQTDGAAASRSRRPVNRVRDAVDTDSVDAGTPLAVPADAPIPPENRARARGAIMDKVVPVAAGVTPTTAMRHTLRSARAPIALLPWFLRMAALREMAVRTQRTWMGLRKV